MYSFFFCLMNRQRHQKSGPFPNGTLCRNRPAMPFDNFSDDGQSDTGPFILPSSVQPLKDGENAIKILLIKTNAVILDCKQTLLFIWLRINTQLGRDVNKRRDPCLVEF